MRYIAGAWLVRKSKARGAIILKLFRVQRPCYILGHCRSFRRCEPDVEVVDRGVLDDNGWGLSRILSLKKKQEKTMTNFTHEELRCMGRVKPS